MFEAKGCAGWEAYRPRVVSAATVERQVGRCQAGGGVFLLDAEPHTLYTR